MAPIRNVTFSHNKLFFFTLFLYTHTLEIIFMELRHKICPKAIHSSPLSAVWLLLYYFAYSTPEASKKLFKWYVDMMTDDKWAEEIECCVRARVFMCMCVSENEWKKISPTPFVEVIEQMYYEYFFHTTIYIHLHRNQRITHEFVTSFWYCNWYRYVFFFFFEQNNF